MIWWGGVPETQINELRGHLRAKALELGTENELEIASRLDTRDDSIGIELFEGTERRGTLLAKFNPDKNTISFIGGRKGTPVPYELPELPGWIAEQATIEWKFATEHYFSEAQQAAAVSAFIAVLVAKSFDEHGVLKPKDKSDIIANTEQTLSGTQFQVRKSGGSAEDWYLLLNDGNTPGESLIMIRVPEKDLPNLRVAVGMFRLEEMQPVITQLKETGKYEDTGLRMKAEKFTPPVEDCYSRYEYHEYRR